MNPFHWPARRSLPLTVGATAAGLIALWYTTHISPAILLGVGITIAVVDIWRATALSS